jgi:hypothetical protein
MREFLTWMLYSIGFAIGMCVLGFTFLFVVYLGTLNLLLVPLGVVLFGAVLGLCLYLFDRGGF